MPSSSQSTLPGLFDTHIHFFDEHYSQSVGWDFSKAITSAREQGVSFFCNVGTNLETSQKAFALAKKHDYIFAACGYHPTMVDRWNDQSFSQLSQLLRESKVVAVGEIGLDFYHRYTTPQLQKKILAKQLTLAVKMNKPVLLHIRQAYQETLQIVKKHPVRGIVHCFSGTLAEAQQFIDLGFFISFSGVLTFANATSLQKIAQTLPLNKIVLETDAPYLAPTPFRGKLNLPEYLLLTAQKLAQLQGFSLKTVMKQTTANAFTALNIVNN